MKRRPSIWAWELHLRPEERDELSLHERVLQESKSAIRMASDKRESIVKRAMKRAREVGDARDGVSA